MFAFSVLEKPDCPAQKEGAQSDCRQGKRADSCSISKFVSNIFTIQWSYEAHRWIHHHLKLHQSQGDDIAKVSEDTSSLMRKLQHFCARVKHHAPIILIIMVTVKSVLTSWSCAVQLLIPQLRRIIFQEPPWYQWPWSEMDNCLLIIFVSSLSCWKSMISVILLRLTSAHWSLSYHLHSSFITL